MHSPRYSPRAVTSLGGRVRAPAFLLYRFIVVPQVSAAVAPAIGTVTRKQLQNDRVSVALGALARDRDFQLWFIHATQQG